MSLTPSNMLPLGTPAPHFSLTDVVSQKTLSLEHFKGEKGLLVLFICRHCPYVVHVEKELARVGRDYGPKGFDVIAISANDADHYPDDRPEGLKEQALKAGFTFPYLYDENQSVAKAFTAACTPDIFLFDGTHRLVYRGQIDDSRPGNGKPVTGKDLRDALNALLNNTPVPQNQRPSTGCNIKWKSDRAIE